ncbi:Protein CBG10243 [Caenorhabditis briggsae]|uniref:RRM domain-containing protein n=3 Tax=Caenorhabditis briggsae TaxID=6238 RepID=A0AAE8ZUX1_CAEBR|nr:Protein CBG10243 [Caenorhabditis briggsae]ULT85115.1 hypothetical protein L3Y34_013669 [Caenorhabditis briggsae]CAP29736.2 Protein CBG10243 [Caenorhabditis briggsae]
MSQPKKSYSHIEGRIFLGNLPTDIDEDLLRDFFKTSGEIKYIDVKKGKAGRPGYGFMEFVKLEDAEKAVKTRNGFPICDKFIRVEFSTSGGPRGPGGMVLREGEISEEYSVARGRGGPQLRSVHRVYVDNCPPSTTWQDIKDLFRGKNDPTGIEVCFSAINPIQRRAFVEFRLKEDVAKAIRLFHNKPYINYRNEESVLSIYEDPGNAALNKENNVPTIRISSENEKTSEKTGPNPDAISSEASPSSSTSGRSTSSSPAYSSDSDNDDTLAASPSKSQEIPEHRPTISSATSIPEAPEPLPRSSKRSRTLSTPAVPTVLNQGPPKAKRPAPDHSGLSATTNESPNEESTPSNAAVPEETESTDDEEYYEFSIPLDVFDEENLLFRFC